MLFRSCLPGLASRCGVEERNDNNGGNYNIRSVLKMDPSTGALQVPSYTQISRADHCPLLKHAWGQNWDELIKVCANQPWRTLHMTKYSGRTALHLATFDRSCPLRVARALLKANRQMIAVRDSNNYTPLHIVAFFSAATSLSQSENVSISLSSGEQEISTGEAVTTNPMGRAIEDDERGESTESSTTSQPSLTSNANANSESEAVSVMSLFCDTAIMVEQELGRATGNNREEQQMPLFEGTSPLYLAAKKGAPVSILKILLETRSRTNWIAPSTGGEPYWYENTNKNTQGNETPREKESPNASFSSPLEILLREDRLRSSMNGSYYRNDAFLLGEEEDGNLLRRGRSNRNSSSSTAASRSCDKMTANTRRSPLHPDEIHGVPHLREEMRRLATNRCCQHYRHEEFDAEGKKCLDDRQPHVSNGDDSYTGKTPALTHSQQRCLELWEKCIELLVTAGGGGIPLLSVEKDDYIDEAINHNDGTFVPYGILHACVCCKVPVPSLVEVALILFPEQVFHRDARHGMVPLHHVLCAKHKYSYATSNLLTILLKGRANINTPLGSKHTRKYKKENRHHLSIQSERKVESTVARIPKVPSLSNCKHCNDGEDEYKMLFSDWPNARYLQSTVLLPFLSTKDSSVIGFRNDIDIREFNRTIPLIFAIRSGLPMDGVINKLLEANSYESLRTIDPISRLPPFALIAMKPCHSELEAKQQRDDYFDIQQLTGSNEGATTTILATKSGKDHSNDIITAAIGSTINILSSGDGNNDVEMPSTSAIFPFSSSTSSSSDICTKSTKRSPIDKNTSCSPYELDNIYHLLLAHPQVLAQCIPD